MEFRVVGPDDADLLADLFAGLDQTFFRPHPFTPDEAAHIAARSGRDVYAMLLDDGRPVAYGLLRGWDEGFTTPALGVAVRNDSIGRGLGRAMMKCLHQAARERGASQVRLRVHAANARARRLYDSMGYIHDGEDRGELVMIKRLEDPPLVEGGPP